ncbi:MAG: DUF739 family protein [Ruminococcus sp.]|nr:DUF739 family protein [Ruminococcus sp.]MCM1382146.1 DUF739 family protein [Muribaculaceae bacterium]MCM1480829.1 DUF739 family protein [Muribaculaceae bacterium]
MKPYAKLRGRMAEMEVTGEDLANHIERSKTYVSNRLTHSYSWSIDEVYKILDFLEIPESEIFTYFPPNGGLTKKTAH